MGLVCFTSRLGALLGATRVDFWATFAFASGFACAVFAIFVLELGSSRSVRLAGIFDAPVRGLDFSFGGAGLGAAAAFGGASDGACNGEGAGGPACDKNGDWA